MTVYLVVVVPVDKVRRLRAVLHQASQVDGGARVDVHVGASQNVCVWLCGGRVEGEGLVVSCQERLRCN